MPPAPPRSVILGLYLALSAQAGGYARRLLRKRETAGKEDPDRIGERMGRPALPRPDGELAWFHAASVGESVSLLELLRRLPQVRPGLTCLVTTGTRTSADMMASRLPEGCIHQYVPLDVLPWVRHFLDQWRPDIAVWTESELWPGLVTETRRRDIPMLLINARISEKTYRSWGFIGRGMVRGLLGRFDRILAQDELALQQLVALGAPRERIEAAGTLKEGAAPLPHDEAERRRISDAINSRPVWAAASTHEGEEEPALNAHLQVQRSIPGLLLVLIPRHPDRGDRVAGQVRAAGLNAARRSEGEQITADTDVYLADTLGEMGLWYRIAPVSFVGGSLVEVGGHNPYEPALLGSAVIHGPHVRNFAGAYQQLTKAGAATLVLDAAGLSVALAETLAPERAAEMAAAGWETVSESAGVTDRVAARICETLDGEV